MDLNKNKTIHISPLRRINVEGGDVLHVIRNTDHMFNGFGEAYFSIVQPGYVKAWKRHLKMTMNLIVPIGSVKFIFYDESKELIMKIEIGEKNYRKVSVPPGIWFGFVGLSKHDSYILNIADILHDPSEVERKPVSYLPLV